MNWEYLARATLHPMKVTILETMAANPDLDFSASTLAAMHEWKVPLTSYHLRQMDGHGWIRPTRRIEHGAAVETFFAIERDVERALVGKEG